MDAIRAEETRLAIHKKAVAQQKAGDLAGAEQTYRDALRIYPAKPGMLLGLASTLALKGETEEAIELSERGLSLSQNEKQKATVRAVLCFLYLRAGETKKATHLAATLPHRRECREEILPLMQQPLREDELDAHIRRILLDEE